MELRVTWGIPEEVWSPIERALPPGELVDVVKVAGFDSKELARLSAEAPVELVARQEQGSVGKGAAGYGVTLVLEVVEVVSNFGGLIALGEFIRRLIVAQAKKRGAPTIKDPVALGAVAAAGLDARAQARFSAFRFTGTVGVTTDGSSGTDERDIWACCFGGEALAVVIFMSPSGRYLGSVEVPAEWGPTQDGYRRRTTEEIAALWVGHPGA